MESDEKCDLTSKTDADSDGEQKTAGRGWRLGGGGIEQTERTDGHGQQVVIAGGGGCQGSK